MCLFSGWWRLSYLQALSLVPGSSELTPEYGDDEISDKQGSISVSILNHPMISEYQAKVSAIISGSLEDVGVLSAFVLEFVWHCGLQEAFKY